MEVKQALLFCAGLGTRFKPWTDQHPKALAPVHDRSLLLRNIQYLSTAGIERIIVNVHHFADQIIAALEQSSFPNTEIIISDETDAVLETGGGLVKAQPLFEKNQPFLTLNVDILTDLPIDKFRAAHTASKALISLAVANRATSRYFLWDEQLQLSGWRNKKTGDEKITRSGLNLQEKAFSGMALYDYTFFDLVRQIGKFSLVDSFLDLSTHQRIIGWEAGPHRWIDVGKPDSVQQAEQLFSS